MKDHPIIFSAPMILALLAGRKTMTRRLARQDFKAAKEKDRAKLERAGCIFERRGGTSPSYGSLFAARPSPWQRVQPGDRLWVRESLYQDDKSGNWLYRADHKPIELDVVDGSLSAMVSWAHHKERDTAPSIHMPRWASRLTLVVTATKIEQLHDITLVESMREGIERREIVVDGETTVAYSEDFNSHANFCPRETFRLLWTWLHGKDSWDENPEVVALSFTVHKQNIDALAEAA